jgi:hypothetical protein
LPLLPPTRTDPLARIIGARSVLKEAAAKKGDDESPATPHPGRQKDAGTKYTSGKETLCAGGWFRLLGLRHDSGGELSRCRQERGARTGAIKMNT